MATREEETLLRATVDRMLKEARGRIADGDLLSGSLSKQSDADYLLRLLAFEILLKAVHLMHVGKPKRSHSYCELFDALPDGVRSSLVNAAGERMSTSADYSDIPELLRTFSDNFIRLRYPYEDYENLSPEEYAELGEAWIARGAPECEATFVYHPEGLYGLTHALEQHLTEWLTPMAPD